MRKLLSCEFNIDTACVELKFADGTMISIDYTAVEDEVARTCTSDQSWIIWSTMTR